MDLLVVPVPLFDKNMAVEAYYFRYQEGNGLIRANQATNVFDGVVLSPLLATLNIAGTDAFAMSKPVFVPVNHLMLMANLHDQCKELPEKVVFVIDGSIKSEEPYLSNIKKLKKDGFRFAIQMIERLESYEPIVDLCDYFFFNHTLMHLPNQQLMYAQVKKSYASIKIVMTHIESTDYYDALRGQASMFEGHFYTIPVTKGENKVSPLKLNLINLLNLVRNENFEFSAVAAIVQRDTALTVSLMRMINSPFLGLRQKVKSINHAVTILGQIETRKWVTTAVSRLLGADRPDELTRLSLIRAKFAENLAEGFNMKQKSSSLFLMGLFSVLDVILEMTMEDALSMVQVSDSIRDALLECKGEFGALLNFIYKYEFADWNTVSRILIVYDLNPEDIYTAYINALLWYRSLITGGDTD